MEIISQLKLRGISVENNHDDSTEYLEIRNTYVLKDEMRGASLASHDVVLTEDNILEFQFEDDTVWISDPGSMDELFPEAVANLKSRGVFVFELPSEIPVEEAQRGLFKNIALKVFKVFTKKKVIGPLVGVLARELEDKMLQKERGLLRVARNFNLVKAIDIQSDLHLLMIHGTAASTLRTFGHMRHENENDPAETELWQAIFSKYKDNVIAFEHESLTKSPLENVLDLVNELPNEVVLHLLTQSRGGLVGEILNKFCDEKSGGKGFSEEEKKYLKDHDRKEDAETIEKIEHALTGKNIRIEKFVRVACPANGTTLASKRLDVWLNVIFNVAGLALAQSANPIYIAFKNLLTSVVETKDNPDVLPGLAPQNPESALNKVLNNSESELELSTPLLIVAGDNKLSFKFKALLGVLTNLFFLGKNDFVVNTRSMFQGARRMKGGARYFQDESQDVNHFAYFKNPSTRGAISRALQAVNNSTIQGFTTVPENVLEKETLRGITLSLSKGELRPRPVSGNRPIAIIVPGIMGSNLYDKDDLVWVNFAGFFGGSLSRLEHSANNKNITALSLVGDSYRKLYEHLSSEYDVTVFPFDWRLPMEANTGMFKEFINEILKKKKPIKLIGHSMGGVLIRDFMIDHPKEWNDLNNSPDFSLLFLGAPLNGSFRIAYVLFGRDSLIKKLGLIDTKNSKKDLLKFFTQFPGILSLLPLTTDAANDFGNFGTWEKMKNADGDDSWPLPTPQLLADFAFYRKKVLERTPSLDLSKAVYVAGMAGSKAGTISGYQIVSKSLFFKEKLKLEFKATLEGDGSVTWESGIPKKLIQEERVYYSDVEHGELANDERLFVGISDILKSGSTKKIPTTRPLSSRGLGLSNEFIAPDSFDFDNSEAGLKSAILGLRSPEKETTVTDLPINVTVAHGNLKYASYPVLIGHFEDDGIVSAEKVADHSLNNELSRRLKLGLYAGAIGTSTRVLTGEYSSFKGVIVLGLGKQGVLNDRFIATTIEQGVANHLIKLIESSEGLPDVERKTGISSLIIGSGYGGLSVESCVRAILEAIQRANRKIKEIYGLKAFTVSDLEFIELYQDNSLACMKALKLLESAEGSNLSIQRITSGIVEKIGRRQRIPTESTVEWWTRISVRKQDSDQQFTDKKNRLYFAITTSAARIEERLLPTTGKEIARLVELASIKGQWSPEIAKALFELLIPNDFKATIKQLNNILLQLDDFTATFPWELLQDTLEGGSPLCINSGLIRQLVTPNFRIAVNTVTASTALIISDPDLENPQMQLAAAETEGFRVKDLLTEKGYAVNHENRGTVDKILIKLFSQNYKILHLAGHGVFEFGEDKQTGMLIGKDTFLTPALIDQMSSVPELVFVNCCFLGQADAGSEEFKRNRHQLAANLGTQLIRIGVKAVVVAGWAVNDRAALYFAEIVYQALLRGKTFGEAAKSGRKAVFETSKNQSNTWGAYQCYGDPFYRLTNLRETGNYQYDFEVPALAEIELNNLKNELDAGRDTNDILLKLNAVNLALKKGNIGNAKITELLSLIYSSLGLYEEAIRHFKTLSTISKADFSLSALEQYCNVRAKYYIQQVKAGKSVATAIEEMNQVLADINVLLTFGKTDERFNILGSTLKRLATLSSGAEKRNAYKKAHEAYDQAFLITSFDKKYYPLTNSVALKFGLALITPSKTVKGKTDDTDNGIKDLKAKLKAEIEVEIKSREIKTNGEQNYWSLVANADLALCKYLLTPPKKGFDDLVNLYVKVWNNAGHLGNKQGTFEHLDILIDLYGLSDEGKEIVSVLKELKKKLEGLG